VRLYKAIHFPGEWVYCATLIERDYIADSSLFYFNGCWWMFAETGENLKFDTLSLYNAALLTGPWSEHPQSPIVRNNPHTARPGGRVLVDGSRIIRFAQDCAPNYGINVFAFEVEELTAELYSERPLVTDPIIGGIGGTGWNSNGMHHIDAHRLDDSRWIACVDGYRTGKFARHD
jgi:hypothetical protein